MSLSKLRKFSVLALIVAPASAGAACAPGECGPLVLPSVPAQQQLQQRVKRVNVAATIPAAKIEKTQGVDEALAAPDPVSVPVLAPVPAQVPVDAPVQVVVDVTPVADAPAEQPPEAGKKRKRSSSASAAAGKGLFAPAPESTTGVEGFRTDLDGMKPMEIKVTAKGGVPASLASAVRKAISDSATIKVSEGVALDALAGIDVAASNLYPQIDGRLAGGSVGSGDWQATLRRPYFDRKKAYGAASGEASIVARQTVYDFGATRSSIARAAASTEAQNFSVLQTVEDVAYKTADAYLKVLQERELVDLTAENLDSLKEIADLVAENQKNGNGTVADVKRVNARVIDAAAAKADEDLALKLASDQLRRQTRVDPGRLGPAPSLSNLLPADDVKALSIASTTNPGLQSYKASMQSREAEIASIRAGQRPKVVAEVSAANRQFQAVNDKTRFDGSAMLGINYKFYDGGLASAQIEQVRARMLQDEMRMRDAYETIENDLRQNYFTMRVAREKAASLAEGVDLNAKARVLYREQFRGGKRSLLELLEVQQAYYLARRTQVTNQFDERRAGYIILRSLGRFAVAALRTP
jgi:outer membrane protein TolC